MKFLFTTLFLLMQVTSCFTCSGLQRTKDIEIELDNSIISKLSPNCDYQRVMIDIPPRGGYTIIIVQLHTQYKIVSTSFRRQYVYGNAYNSSDSAILKLLERTEERMLVYIGSNSTTPALSSLFAIGYVGRAPIPGGCCLTCAMEIDPNLKIEYHYGMAYLFFHRASQYYFPSGGKPSCDNNNSPSTYHLKYEIYYLYVDGFATTSFFDAIWKMATPKRIKEFGTRLSEISGRSLLKLTLQPVKGQGIVFNVIVYDPESKLSTAYVPIGTYNCQFDGPNADCYVKADTTSIVYSALCGIIGIALCVAGLKLLRLLLFIVGWLFYWLFVYVTIYRLFIGNANEADRKDSTVHDAMIISSLCAICGGAVTIFFYAFKRLLIFSFLTLGVFTGMFMTSIIFYSPIGQLSFWKGDEKFLFAFICISLVLATFFFFVPKFLCIFSSSAVGSYAVILVPNYFFNGTLQYVILVAVLRLSSSPDFFLERPYITSDYILSAAWVLLFAIGMVIQHCSTRHEKMEMSVLYFNRNRETQHNETRIGNGSEQDDPEDNRPLISGSVDQLHDPNERTPLFHNSGPTNSSLAFNPGYPRLSTFDTLHRYPGVPQSAQPSAPPRPPSPPPPYTLLPAEER